MTVAELARLKAAAFDVEQALGELLGTPATNCYAWSVVQRLVDVFVASENLRVGPLRRKADGSPRERRPRGAACRIVGVSYSFLQQQINRARARGRRGPG